MLRINAGRHFEYELEQPCSLYDHPRLKDLLLVLPTFLHQSTRLASVPILSNFTTTATLPLLERSGHFNARKNLLTDIPDRKHDVAVDLALNPSTEMTTEIQGFHQVSCCMPACACCSDSRNWTCKRRMKRLSPSIWSSAEICGF